MKRKKLLVFIVVIVILIALLFSKYTIFVFDKSSNIPVSYAEISLPNFSLFADVNGKASFVSSAFQKVIKVDRIGYSERKVNLPFHIIYTNEKIYLDRASYGQIQAQIDELLKKANTYSYYYKLSVGVSGGTPQTQVISARYDGKNFLFSNKSDFTGADYKILSKNGRLYLWKDNKFTPLTDEERDNFASQHILFISPADIVSSLFLNEGPSNIEYNSNVIIFHWDSSTNKGSLSVSIDKNGFPVEYEFENVSEGKVYKVNFSIHDINKHINVEK